MELGDGFTQCILGEYQNGNRDEREEGENVFIESTHRRMDRPTPVYTTNSRSPVEFLPRLSATEVTVRSLNRTRLRLGDVVCLDNRGRLIRADARSVFGGYSSGSQGIVTNMESMPRGREYRITICFNGLVDMQPSNGDQLEQFL